MTIEKNDELVCYCIKVTKQTIINSIQKGNYNALNI
jgi:NAD(P)H-nitrite reductase large subunit